MVWADCQLFYITIFLKRRSDFKKIGEVRDEKLY